jgi:hypothetical protein
MLSRFEENFEMNWTRTTQEIFVDNRTQQYEGHVTLKYVGIGVGRLHILTLKN